ncbi:S-M checkpoint control protein rad4 [Pseudocercospora fuligena]|uniref:S-M checkpoint control protein rad4 n=1 Tax=Pseudocercospora fuligena TaxID=685502 RepID=A0A8H6RR85_9PEZI|nr:S-M checkpoint control protein rad4 [Pseudocercospora fuligena]
MFDPIRLDECVQDSDHDALQKTRIAEVAKQLGAVHKLDLTSDVTHLLVGDINTPKYKYVAKERPEVKVLHPEFIDKVNEAWRDGEDFTVEKLQSLEEEHKIPAFASLQICITGFEDPDFRKSIERDVETRGGKYSPDLVKSVTHLIAARPEGAKYTHAKQWRIKVVGLKWLEDCIIRGMVVDESLYLPELPRVQQGVGAFRTEPRRPESGPGKRTREDAATPAEQGPRKKLRKSASMKLGGQSQDMWQSFSQHEVQVETSLVDAWQDTHAEDVHKTRDSLAPRRSDVTEVIERNDPVEPTGLFAGYYVLIHGFDAKKTRQLRGAIEKENGVVVRSGDELGAASENIFFKSRCLLMPHAQPTKLPDVPPGTLLVTEWWAERCIYFKQKLDPDDDALSQPLSESLIPAFSKLKISITGFNQVDFRMTAETVKLMGAEYQEQLLPSTSILICASNDVKREKALYASKHNIPVVSSAWLWASLRSREKVAVDMYRFKLPAYDHNQLTPGGSSDSSTLSARPQPNGFRGQEKRADDLSHPKRLSNTRRRHATPLVLKAGPVAKPTETVPKKSRPGPFIHEDDDEDDTEAASMPMDDNVPKQMTTSHATKTPNAESLPLKEISPNTSQPRTDRPSEDKHTSTKPRHDNPDTDLPLTDKAVTILPQDDSHEPELPPKSPRKGIPSPAKENAVPAPKMMSELTSDLASILNRRVASGQDAVSHANMPEMRKHRPLGRNLSGTSLTNLAARHSASPAMSAVGEEGEYSAADGFAPSKQEVIAPPGTQLGYGGNEESSGRRVMSVKDSDEIATKKEAVGAAAAAGSRKAARSRTKA